MTEEEERYQKIIIYDESLKIKMQFDNVKRFLSSTIPPIINMIVEERLKAYSKQMTLDGELELQFVKKELRS